MRQQLNDHYISSGVEIHTTNMRSLLDSVESPRGFLKSGICDPFNRISTSSEEDNVLSRHDHNKNQYKYQKKVIHIHPKHNFHHRHKKQKKDVNVGENRNDRNYRSKRHNNRINGNPYEFWNANFNEDRDILPSSKAPPSVDDNKVSFFHQYRMQTDRRRQELQESRLKPMNSEKQKLLVKYAKLRRHLHETVHDIVAAERVDDMEGYYYLCDRRAGIKAEIRVVQDQYQALTKSPLVYLTSEYLNKRKASYYPTSSYLSANV